ncbi:MAG TPA: glycosyltransferase family 1 protein, partial [Chitinophagaceae bacterium]|nr:glycosyltransferase family 1 protein [Chitinophagaceae bacterium]
MRIGFDAKRAFHNSTGLGNYSRTLISGLAAQFPEHQYYLFNPKPARRIRFQPEGPVTEIQPQTLLQRKLSSAWRSSWVKNDLQRLGIDLYHGLSHEIPSGIGRTGIRSVVTIHDLIFERYPDQFSAIDRAIYRRKFRYACTYADRIIAISRQTKEDVIRFYGIPENRIDVCYQSCDPAFSVPVDEITKGEIRSRYRLPETFFLSVGSIIERKNLLGVCAALESVKDLGIPLVVIGKGDGYEKKVRSFVQERGLHSVVHFLHDRPEVQA